MNTARTIIVKGTSQITITARKDGGATWTASGGGVVSHVEMKLAEARAHADRLLGTARESAAGLGRNGVSGSDSNGAGTGPLEP